MGLETVFRNAAITAMGVFSSVSTVCYYHSVGTKTYNTTTGTQTEADAVEISAVDLSCVASTNSINSVSTNFTSYTNIDTSLYLKIAGFTTSGNNGFALPVTVSANSLVISGLTLTNELAGDSVTIFGNFVKLDTVIFTNYSVEEKKNSDIEPGDVKALILPSQLGLTPKIDDYVYRVDTGEKWIVKNKRIDPANALWQCQMRI